MHWRLRFKTRIYLLVAFLIIYIISICIYIEHLSSSNANQIITFLDYRSDPGIFNCSSGIQIEITHINKVKQIFVLVIKENIFAQSLIFNYYTWFFPPKYYNLVYALESEAHTEPNAIPPDFLMWYDLDESFPEPVTYFDVREFLPDLLAQPLVKFEDKESSAPVVWVLSNCIAFNKREKFVEKLMGLVNIDSYGNCLNNKKGYLNNRMTGNIELYSRYKLLSAIENSNCKDYVTEKLVHAVASGSIPIVAGRNNRPDYLRFMPKGSYINIYDFMSVEHLANYLIMLSNDKVKYEKYISFKHNHNYTRENLMKLPLNDIIRISKTIINPNEIFFNELIAKENSENKFCKVANYLSRTPDKVVRTKTKQVNRPSVDDACLPKENLMRDFKLN